MPSLPPVAIDTAPANGRPLLRSITGWKTPHGVAGEHRFRVGAVCSTQAILHHGLARSG